MLRAVGRCDIEVVVAQEGHSTGGLAILQFAFVTVALVGVEVHRFAFDDVARLAVYDAGRLLVSIDEFVAFPAQLPSLGVELCGILSAEVQLFEREELLCHELTCCHDSEECEEL